MRIYCEADFFNFVFKRFYDILIFNKVNTEMTKSEFQKKVIELIKKYHPDTRMKEKILPLFSIADNLTQEEMINVYQILEEAIITQKESDRLADKLNNVFSEFNNTIKDVTKRLTEIKKRLDYLNAPEVNSLQHKGNYPGGAEFIKIRYGNTMKFNKHSLPGEKPNFGLKLNKLFSSYITEYGPEYVTMVVSDSILYLNNLILRISLKNQDVLIGSSKSLKVFETVKNSCFLVTDKPEVIPYGNRKGFYFKYITYEDILNLTNGDFFKVFEREILENYKQHEIDLPYELEDVGYFKFD